MHGTLRKVPQQPRSRRDRRCDRFRNPVLHLVMPGQEVGRETPRPRETVTAFLRRTGWASRDRRCGWQFKKGLPTVLEINGEPVLRKSWTTTRIAANDNVRFISYPLGGQNGAKQVLGLVALVAVSAFAIWAGPALFGAGTIGAYATTAAIGIGGALAISALTAPKAGATNAPGATQDQIYSVSAQGNIAKLGQPLPVWYGRLKTFPDFAATPWGEFVGNDQYLNLILSIGMGSFAYETVYVDDTPFWNAGTGLVGSYEGAQIEFYEAGEPVTLFPVSVSSSSEVNGQQLPDGAGTFGGKWELSSPQTSGAWVGGFVSNPAGTLVQAIAIDFVMPAGCFTVNTDSEDPNANNIGLANVGIEAEICPVNDAGAPIGSYAPLFSILRPYSSNAPIRDSVKVDVGAGRYLVRVRRRDAALPTQQGVNTVVWAGMRAFLKGENSFPDVATVAIRLKSSQSTQGSYKFGVLATRKLPVWNGSIFEAQPTRNPGWALLDAATNAQYGAGISLAKVDFNAIVAFADGCQTRGDAFDYVFTSAVAAPEALDKIVTPARARHFWLGDTLSVVRDEWRDVPAAMVTDREIVRDSMTVAFQMLGDEDPDAVRMEYIDEETWRPAQVQYPPDSISFTALNAETRRIDGIVQRDHAYREAAFWYRQSIYRREKVELNLEYEGRAVTFGSVLRVQSDLPMNYGQGGGVVAAAGSTLTLRPAASWGAGPFYIRLRRPNGKWFGPVLVTRGGDDGTALLDSADLAAVQSAQGTTLAAALAREIGAEDPSFEFASAESESKLCMVLSGAPNGGTFKLSLVVDDVRVHEAAIGAPPVLPPPQFPSNPTVPLVVGLAGTLKQGNLEPILSASWFPTLGALYYIAEVSYDDGATWQQVYEGQDTKFSVVAALAEVRLRVQAVTDTVRGPYSVITLEAPPIKLPPGSVSHDSLDEAIKYEVTKTNEYLNDKLDEATQLIASIASNQDSRNWLDKKELRSQLEATAGGAKAAVEEVRLVAVDANTAVAALSTSVSASFGEVYSNISINASAITTLDGYAASAYGAKLDVNGNVVGFELVNGGPGTDSTTFITSKFQIAAPGVSGGAAVPIFTVASVNGVPKVGLRADMYVDGSITVNKLDVVYLSSITANIGEVIAGILRSADSKFIIDLDNARIEIWS